MEFIITGYLNVCDLSALETGLSGEIFSYILGWFGIVVTLIVIPGLFIMILGKPKDDSPGVRLFMSLNFLKSTTFSGKV